MHSSVTIVLTSLGYYRIKYLNLLWCVVLVGNWNRILYLPGTGNIMEILLPLAFFAFVLVSALAVVPTVVNTSSTCVSSSSGDMLLSALPNFQKCFQCFWRPCCCHFICCLAFLLLLTLHFHQFADPTVIGIPWCPSSLVLLSAQLFLWFFLLLMSNPCLFLASLLLVGVSWCSSRLLSRDRSCRYFFS